MKPSGITGVFNKDRKLFTQNPKKCKGLKVYNERLFFEKGMEFRSWNPYRSKLAAAILNGLKKINIDPDSNVLYLGAATGTTVSHISDMLKDGMVYAVENSPIAMKQFINICKVRSNIIPIFEDANHPDRYSTIVPMVDLVYQDISQRNQSEIFINNLLRFLKKGSLGIIMVKARSIDVSLKPKQAYELVQNKLEKANIKIVDLIELSPYEKDHAAIVVNI